MKLIWASAAGAVVGLVLAGCSGAGSDPGSSSSEAISAAPANTIMKVNPELPSLTSRGPTTASGAVGECPPHERVCEFANDKGICVDRCVPDGVMCVKPNCVVCDPVGAQPRSGCTWSTTACEWECPVCDPIGMQPRAGCTWSTTACDWECPVCDPPPPPLQGGCTWDPKACVWLCL